MSNQFDISKPVFDLLSLRSIRGDAVVRYDSLNQSEPLRITLFGLFCMTFLIAPTFTEAVGYEPMTLPAVAASIVGALASGGLFVRECTRRASQLARIEKELNTERLPIRLPTNPLAEMPFSKPVTLKDLKTSTAVTSGQQPPRLIAVCGDETKLTEALSSLAIFGNRLKQASTYVVAVSTDGSTSNDWKTLDPSMYKSWLADPYQPNVWLVYFQELSESIDQSNNFRWFGLTARGQSWGSGEGEIPEWLQVLGQYLRPTDFLDVEDEASSNLGDTEAELSESLQSFYQALTTGDEDGIERIFAATPSCEVTAVMDAGGRIDTWEMCLADGARPSDMKTSGADVIVVSDTEAYTTVIEFPANTRMDSASLLAVQQWKRDSITDQWRLQLHQTIPWSLETKAQGTLRCDCRGCVALTRSRERRTFGGMIG
jgi:hypothetical protein